MLACCLSRCLHSSCSVSRVGRNPLHMTFFFTKFSSYITDTDMLLLALQRFFIFWCYLYSRQVERNKTSNKSFYTSVLQSTDFSFCAGWMTHCLVSGMFCICVIVWRSWWMEHKPAVQGRFLFQMFHVHKLIALPHCNCSMHAVQRLIFTVCSSYTTVSYTNYYRSVI